MIAEPLVHAHVLQRDGLPTEPTHAPTAHRIRFHSQFPGDLPIILALCRSQDHAPSSRYLLRCAVPTHQRFQLPLLSPLRSTLLVLDHTSSFLLAFSWPSAAEALRSRSARQVLR